MRRKVQAARAADEREIARTASAIDRGADRKIARFDFCDRPSNDVRV